MQRYVLIAIAFFCVVTVSNSVKFPDTYNGNRICPPLVCTIYKRKAATDLRRRTMCPPLVCGLIRKKFVKNDLKETKEVADRLMLATGINT